MTPVDAARRPVEAASRWMYRQGFAMHGTLLHPPSSHRWFAVDFDRQPARVIASSLFLIQVAFFVVGRLADFALSTDAAYGFMTTMLLFAALVFVDAISVRMPVARAAFWAAVVMFGTILGAIPYARRRQHLTRTM